MTFRLPFFARRLGALVVVALILSSCGFGRMATGVVVWAPDQGTVHNGDLVWVWEQSRIRKSFKIERPEGGGNFEIDQWRVRSFTNEGEAQAFQKAFAPLKDTWAVSGKQGLPVRESADANASRVYKLGENEEVKVADSKCRVSVVMAGSGNRHEFPSMTTGKVKRPDRRTNPPVTPRRARFPAAAYRPIRGC